MSSSPPSGPTGRHGHTNPEPDRGVLALGVLGNTLAISEGFTGMRAAPRNHLAAVNADGTLSPWNPDTGGQVYALVVSGDTIYAGGDFTSIAGAARESLRGDQNGRHSDDLESGPRRSGLCIGDVGQHTLCGRRIHRDCRKLSLSASRV